MLSHIVDPDAGLMCYYLWLADGTKYGVQEVLPSYRTRIYKGSFTYKGATEADAKSVSFSGGEFLAEGTGTAKQFTPNYILSDRLGSPRVVMDSNGSTIVRNNYYPFGLTHYNYLYNEQLVRSNRYHFNGKEKQTFSTLIDHHLLDYGSRMYDPYLCRWMNIAPLAESNPMFTGYAYTRNNPVNRIDLMGLADMAVNAGSTDWVYSEGGGYEWMDNVTSAETTPEGFRYVGPKDADIVADLGYKSLYPSQSQTRWGSWFDGDAQGWGIMRNKFEANAYFSVDPIVSYKKENRTENNRMGRTFEGLEFTGNYGFKKSTQLGEKIDIPFVMNVTSEQEEYAIRQRILDETVHKRIGYFYYNISYTVNQQMLRMNRITNLQLTARPNIVNPINNNIMIPSNVVSPYFIFPMRPFNFIQPL